MEKDERDLFSDAKINYRYFEVEENIWIKVYFFNPNTPKFNHSIVFIPGWTSTIYSWRYFLPVISKNINIIYIETREKSSSKTYKNCSYSINDISNDIISIIKALGLKDKTYSFSGSSLGATSILEVLIKSELNPLSLALILPNQYFNIPSLIYLVQYIPNSFFGILKSFVKCYMVYFKIDKNDSDHRISFLRSINKIDGEKIKKSALSFRKYRMKNEMVSKIKIETLVIGASDDPLHDHKQIINISKTLPNCKFIDLISFSRSHSSKAAESILLFLQKVILETNE
jgi:pimeloyl-ACP methyl ester carboxylesterase